MSVTCHKCGKVIRETVKVRDVGDDGKMHWFHQRCAPSAIRNRGDVK